MGLSRQGIALPACVAVCIVAGVVALGGLSACRSSITAPTGVRLDGIDTDVGFRPQLPNKAYIASDQSTADLYFTDLSDEALLLGSDLSGISGTIMHVHMFLIPRAGRTPIAYTASNATVRTMVIANGQIGVYSGGGFMLPSGKPGDETFGGAIRGATLRLTSATEGFEDRLGASEFTGSASAGLDPVRARQIAARLEELVRFATALEIGKPLEPREDDVPLDEYGMPLEPIETIIAPKGEDDEADPDGTEGSSDE